MSADLARKALFDVLIGGAVIDLDLLELEAERGVLTGFTWWRR
jgi:hypothetical protein